MAASSSSSFFSSSASDNHDTNTQISREELFAFHNIDRQLFSRFVFSLRREPSEAMQASACWIWLERFNSTSRYVKNILTIPDELLGILLEETLLCLRVAESDDERGAATLETPMIQTVSGISVLGPRFFYENRILVLIGVGKIVQQVCLRAFQDIIQSVLSTRVEPFYNYYYENELNSKKAPGSDGLTGGTNISANVGTDVGLRDGGRVMTLGQPAPHNPALWSFSNPNLSPGMPAFYPNFDPSYAMIPPQGDPSINILNGTTNLGLINTQNFQNPNFDQGMSSFPHHTPEDDIIEMLSRIHIHNNPQSNGVTTEERLVPTSERTVFVTFSKGYPISEIELREFLSRSFGDIVEALFMQDVGEDEQPLYARLVVPNLSAMEAVLGGQGRAKFSINGKHVWARKYVRKNNPNSPPGSPCHNID